MPADIIHLATLASIVLLPIFPAYLLFKALPSQAGVAGPFQGLQLKLGGAFAGYFVVVAFITFQHNRWAPDPTYQVWEFNGRLTDKHEKPIEPLAMEHIQLSPPTLELFHDGSFKLTFSTIPAPGGGVKYPKLSLSHPSFQALTIDLGDQEFKDANGPIRPAIDKNKRQIKVQSIHLGPPPAYTPPYQPPPQALQPYLPPAKESNP